MTARRLFVGPSGDLEDDAALLARVREVLDVTHFEVGVLPPPGVLVPLLLDPLLPPERGALRSGAYRPDLAPGGPPAAAAATRISDDGQTVVFGDFLTAVTALGPLFGAAARGFVAAGEMARICRRQDLELDDIPETLAWTAADADGRHPTAVPIRVAHEPLRHAAVRFLRRWAGRILALLEGATAPPVYSVQRKSSTSAPPGEAYTGRGRRVSVSATSPDGAASQGDFTLVMDETGEATGLVPSDALVEIPMEPGCPGAGLDPDHKVHAEKMLGGDDGGRGVTLSAAGLVSVLPLCMTSQYRDPVTNAAVALTDLRRYFLSKVLWGLRRDPAQRKQYAALLRSDIAAQGALQRGRMAQAVTRTRAAGAIRPCAGCAFSNWQTCYRELYDGKVGGAVPALDQTPRWSTSFSRSRAPTRRTTSGFSGPPRSRRRRGRGTPPHPARRLGGARPNGLHREYKAAGELGVDSAGRRTKMDPAGMGMEIPERDQNMEMVKDGDKWKYEVEVIERYGLMNPTDDFVRMFANTKLSAEKKMEYIREAEARKVYTGGLFDGVF